MDRIAIIGCGGSGKSRLARSLGGTVGITPGVGGRELSAVESSNVRKEKPRTS